MQIYKQKLDLQRLLSCLYDESSKSIMQQNSIHKVARCWNLLDARLSRLSITEINDSTVLGTAECGRYLAQKTYIGSQFLLK